MELTLDKVTKEFGKFRAVDRVSLYLAGGVHGLLGVNGAGKTTLMRMLCTMMHPTGGTITYDGKEIFSLDREYRKILGYLPQEFGYYPELTVEDYLMYIASIKGIRTPVAHRRIFMLLDMVGMEGEKGKKMKRLSGGMKRRIGIAQAMLNDPKILILDEPTAGLDPMERIRFRNLIENMAEDRIVLLSTHIVSDVEAIAKQVFLMNGGRIVGEGRVADICQRIGTNTLEDVVLHYFGERGEKNRA